MVSLLESLMFLNMLIIFYFLKDILIVDNLKNDKQYKQMKKMKYINLSMIILMLLFPLISNIILKNNFAYLKFINVIFNEISILVLPIITISIELILNRFFKEKIQKINIIIKKASIILTFIYLLTPYVLPLFKKSNEINIWLPLIILQISLFFILCLFFYEIYLLFIFDKLSTRIVVINNYLKNNKDINKLNKFNKKKLLKEYKISYLFDINNVKKIIQKNEVNYFLTKRIDL